MQEVAAADRLVGTDPARALAIVKPGGQRFGGGYLEEERRYITVAALFQLGRADEARPRAARFLADYPHSAYAARVRADLAAHH